MRLHSWGRACLPLSGEAYRRPALRVLAAFCFTRLTNGFSKKLDNHVAAVALYVAHYNLCRVHEALRTTPAKALGVAERAWTIGQLVDAALAVAPAMPT
jgi:hypothetical protein